MRGASLHCRGITAVYDTAIRAVYHARTKGGIKSLIRCVEISFMGDDGSQAVVSIGGNLEVGGVGWVEERTEEFDVG